MNSIKKNRVFKKLTQQNLAEKLCVDDSTVAKWETGAALPRADKLLELARILDCTVDELLRPAEKAETA